MKNSIDTIWDRTSDLPICSAAPCATAVPQNGAACNEINKVTNIFYVLLTVHLDIILVNEQLDAQFFLYMFITILFTFLATSNSSSGE
jgi:hypothetical protein